MEQIPPGTAANTGGSEKDVPMVGETLLRDLGIRGEDRVETEWRLSRTTSGGEDVWESTFRLDTNTETILVTVLHGPGTTGTRVLYAVHAPDNDQMPRIPVAVRRAVEAFVRQLESNAA